MDGPEGETHGCAGWNVAGGLGRALPEIEAEALAEGADLRL